MASSKSVLLSCVAFTALAFAGAASAADLPSRKAALIAPPVLTWTGFYVGLHSGTSAGDVSSSYNFLGPVGVGSPDVQNLNSKLPFGDLFIGAQAGYNWQMANGAVIGVETDFSIGVLRKHASVQFGTYFPGFFNTLNGQARFGLDWQGSTRLRLGYAVTPRFLPYVTGGLAYASIAGDSNWNTFAAGIGTTSIVQGNGSSVRFGWTLGAGFEYALGGNLTFKSEYLYAQYGGAAYVQNTFHEPTTGASGSGPVASHAVGVHTLRTGFNYKFGLPVIAATGGGPLGLFADVPGPRASWTGFYVGVNGGYGGGVLESHLAQFQPTIGGGFEIESIRSKLGMGGFLAGGQAGYNHEYANHIVVGLETDLQWGGARTRGDATFGGSIPGFAQSLTGNARYGLDWHGSTRLRLGYAMGNGVLTYVTGGLAYAGLSGRINWTTSITGFPVFAAVDGSSSAVKLGWTVGFGGEYPITDRLSIRSEFLYARYAGMPVGGGGTLNPPAFATGPMVQTLEVRNVGTSTARVGLNYKFGGFGTAPVVAKY
ncbi:MAG: porin family protein [Methylobacteriaceae bacterium]|nr:porin family protein [Methylobacteriaceae bacterium]